MKVIERYILRRAFSLFVAALSWTLLIVWTTQVLTRLDLVTDNGQSALTFFTVASLVLPSIIPVVVPFAVVIAVAQTLSVMNGDSELIVINAAGSSRWITVRPILLLAGAASVFSFAVDNGIDPYARERNRELVSVARADLLSQVIQEGTFRKIEDGLFVQIGEKLPDNRLGQVFVADSRGEGIELIYYAKSGAVVNRDGKSLLLMTDGVVHRKAPGGEVSVIRFTTYAFDLAAFSSNSGGIRLWPKDRTLQYLVDPDPNDPIFKNAPQLFRAELHKRLTEWVYPFVFALIALAVAGDARSHREARIHPLLTAVVVALFCRWAGFFAESKTETNAAFAVAVYGTPLVFAAGATWFIATGRNFELPVWWAEKLLAATRSLAERMMFLRLRGGDAAEESA